MRQALPIKERFAILFLSKPMAFVRALALVVACVLFQPMPGLGDGAVYPSSQDREPSSVPVVVPDQRALIQYSYGVERLVVETSFLGKGQNFAWVIPLPSPPQINQVNDTFFYDLAKAFQPRLIDLVLHYYVIAIVLAILFYLGNRSLRNETSWVWDLPFILMMSAFLGAISKSGFVGALALGVALYVRWFVRSPTNLAICLLAGLLLSGYALLMQVNAFGFELESSIGEDNGPGIGMDSGTMGDAAKIQIVAVQHTGEFDSTTIKGNDPKAVERWLKKNGYTLPPQAEPIINDYCKKGWVFVASKIVRKLPDNKTYISPLSFTFATPKPIYPMALTATSSEECRVDLYVVGGQRANANLFTVERCDRVAGHYHPGEEFGKTWLKIPETSMDLVGNNEVGTKLTATLTRDQMKSDVILSWGVFLRTGAKLYTERAALTIIANGIIPLGILGMGLIGACHDERLFSVEKVINWYLGFAGILLALAIVAYYMIPILP